METIYYIKKGTKTVKMGDVYALERDGTMVVVNLRTIFPLSLSHVKGGLDMVNPKDSLTFDTKGEAIKGLQEIVKEELERKRSQISAIEEEMAELEAFIKTTV